MRNEKLQTVLALLWYTFRVLYFTLVKKEDEYGRAGTRSFCTLPDG
jgi:hypothetical protein